MNKKAPKHAKNRQPASTMTWRRQLVIAGVLGTLLYCVMWTITATYGPPDIQQRYLAAITTDADARFCRGTHIPQASRVPYDSYDFDAFDRRLRSTPPPWFYLGEARCPMPMIVAVEFGTVQSASLGSGGEVYAIWLFGWSYDFYFDRHWTS